MARTLLTQIVTPEKVAHTSEVEMVVATTPDGEVGILPLHAPLVTLLCSGEVRLKTGSGPSDWEIFSVAGGYLQVYEDRVIVLADRAAAVSMMDMQRLRADRDLTAQRLEDLAEDAAEDERGELQRALDWYDVQIRAAEKARG